MLTLGTIAQNGEGSHTPGAVLTLQQAIQQVRLPVGGATGYLMTPFLTIFIYC
ncbi:hypothetical protein DL93DRAFT_2090287 [Clavulina sp. PMI_390]|nr:hypothetical protein DL93DRAFT_2090287 [Clavulina sp. PMI_390]